MRPAEHVRPQPTAPEERPRAAERGPEIEQPSPSVIKASRIINYVFVLIEGLILIRLLLKVLGGNPANPFVNFVYSLTYPFVYPFLTVFRTAIVSTGIGELELGAIIAIAFYILLNYAIVRLMRIIVSPPEPTEREL